MFKGVKISESASSLNDTPINLITIVVILNPDDTTIVVNIQYKTICCFTLSLISVNSDSYPIRLTQKIIIMELDEVIHFAARIGFKFIILTRRDPDHLWSSCRNFDEVKYALHLCKDDKSRVLVDKPIVWSVTHLVLAMDQMLTGPGIQQQPL
jgi:hypothetical protein